MNLFYGIIYQPIINKLIRNINYVVSPILPSKIKIHPSGILKTKLEDIGTISFKTNQTSFLTRELFWKGAINFEYTSIFIKLIEKVGVFFDIGANIGYYSIVGASCNPELRVVAFEPSEGPMVYASENVKLNHLEKNITIEPVALANTNGKIDFYNLRNKKFPSIYNLSGEHNTGAKKDRDAKKVSVNATRLDNYVTQHKISTIDLIKIDTEGSEHLILKGAEQVLQKYRPIVICETLFNEIETELESIFKIHDYHFYNHTHKGLLKVKSIERKQDDGIRNCFFVPQEKLNLIQEFIIE